MEPIQADPSVTNSDENSPILKPQTFRVYKKRWLILMLYCNYVICSQIHWIQYSVIAELVAQYYSVSLEAVDGTSIIFAIFFIIFSIPGSYVLDKLGLRISVLIGIVGTCVGSWIKVIAVNPNRFWLVLVAQCIIAIFRVLVIPIPAKLAAIWFGADEVSFACALGVISIEISIAVGFILPSLFVEQGDIETLQTGFYHMAYSIAIFTTISVVILFFFFDDAPPTIPSAAQLQMQQNKKISFDYKKALISLLTNKSFVFLLIVFALHGGTATAITILLNQIILACYPNSYRDVGILGLSMCSCGVVGSLILGVLLTKYGRLKLMTWFAFCSCTLVTFLFLFLLDKGLVVVYIFGLTLNFFWSIIFCIAVVLGGEITYPEPEAAYGGLLSNFHQVCTIVITYAYAFISTEFNEFAGNILLVTILLFADVFLFFIKFKLKRSEVDSPNRANSKRVSLSYAPKCIGGKLYCNLLDEKS